MTIIKFFSLFLFVFLIQAHANEEIQEKNGIFYKTNRFGDIFPLWENISEKKLTEKLITFVDTIKEKGAPIIVEIPHEKSPILNAIIKSNFTFYHANQNESQWIVKNGSSIPEPFTAIGGAHILVIKNGKILVVEERTRKGILGFPAGGAERGEFVRDTACRELFEEVGLIAQPQDLKLIALINRKKANKEGASIYGHGFIAEEVSGSLNLDQKEIIQAFWVPVKDLAEATEINHLKVSPYYNALARHIQSGCSHSYSLTLPDPRQTLVTYDPSDTMNVEFFQQNLNTFIQNP